SYLLGKVLLLQLRADEQRRQGRKFSLRDFHDTLLRNGSLPVSFHRKLLQNGSALGASTQTGPAMAARAADSATRRAGDSLDRPRKRAVARRLLAWGVLRDRYSERSPSPSRRASRPLRSA